MTTARRLQAADTASIVQSHQKDEQIETLLTTKLEDLAKKLKSQYFANVYGTEISIAAKTLYLCLSTLRGRRTLGEEYVSLVYLDKKGDKLTNMKQRLLFILSYTLLPYILSKTLKVLSRKYSDTQNSEKEEDGEKPQTVMQRNLSRMLKLIEDHDLRVILNAITDIHLIVFYFKGSFYHISKRIFGLRYFTARTLDESEEKFRQSSDQTYKILGSFLLLKIISKDLPEFWNWSKKSVLKADENKRRPSDDQHSLLLSEIPPDDQVDHIHLEDLEELPFIKESSRKCILCLEWMTDPSCGPCGHVFCWRCLLDWSQKRPECPLCRQTCRMESILPIK
ncbi:LAFA_0G17656g1_1 [Lachancea sp. 'fantastica']|nr:LAFA_0G17656g1_1 [Lachancea sp. 'fantastica']